MNGRYINMHDHIKNIQIKHGTHVAAIVMRLRGDSLETALNVLANARLRK